MERRNQQSNGLGCGFLLGVIVGVLLALLFTTKRGREILKDVLEQGVEKFSDLERLMKEQQAKETTETEESDFVPSTPVSAEVAAEQKKTEIKKPAATPTPVPAPAVPRKEIKTPETQAISPHVVKSVPVVQQVEEIKKEEKKSPEAAEEKTATPPKSTTGKRWFRGLRKRS